ncbi:MAG: helix-turn-helix transcriptional regulator [Candidatus Methanofastidiosa archaeon]|nr:helix-turn-helix transcriptional regulator [Candidatus Methanofastidiosa archaeon]
MINNKRQLKISKKRILEIEKNIEEIKKKYESTEEIDLFISPMLHEKKVIEKEIDEFEKLSTENLDTLIAEKFFLPQYIENIGEYLSKLRLASKINQKDFANILGWQQSNLSRFESENYSGQTIRKIIEYSSALGIYIKIFPVFVDEEEKVEITITPMRYTSQGLSSWGAIDQEELVSTDTIETLNFNKV